MSLRALKGAPLADLMQQALSAIRNTLQVSRAAILRFVPADRSLTPLIADAPDGAQQGRIQLLPGSLEDSVLFEHSPRVLKNNGHEGTGLFSLPIAGGEFAAAVSAVISGHYEPYGLLLIYSINDRGFTEEETHFVQATANLLAQVIERGRIESKLIESERRYRLLFEQNQAGLYRATVNGRILECNLALVTLLGFQSRQELLGRKVSEFHIDPYDLKAIMADLREYGSVRNVELSLRHRDGHFVWALVNAALKRDESGKPDVIEGTLIDITERKHAEEQLSVQYAVTRVLAEATSLDDAMPRLLRGICQTGIWEMGEYWYQRPGEDVLTLRAAWHVPSVEYRQFQATGGDFHFGKGFGLVGRVWANGEHEWLFIKKDDSDFPRIALAGRYGLSKAIAFPIKSGSRVIGVMLFYSKRTAPPDRSLLKLVDSFGSQIGDFIERKRAEKELALLLVREREALKELQKTKDELQSLNEELEHRVEDRTAALVQSNKELEAFSYSISHDLRAPLRAIDGFSRMLEEDYGKLLDVEGLRLLAVVRDNTKKMGQLIDDLLAFSRLGRRAMESQEIDMDALTRSVIEDTRGQNPGRKIEWQIGTLPPSRGDRAMVRQVLVNLLSNAAKFSRERETAVISIAGAKTDDMNLYTVKDNGVGFDMRYSDKLFGVFQRLHAVEEFEGTGVGLAIVKRIVQRHGGRVWAESQPGQGAAFFFTLPGGEA